MKLLEKITLSGHLHVPGATRKRRLITSYFSESTLERGGKHKRIYSLMKVEPY